MKFEFASNVKKIYQRFKDKLKYISKVPIKLNYVLQVPIKSTWASASPSGYDSLQTIKELILLRQTHGLHVVTKCDRCRHFHDGNVMGDSGGSIVCVLYNFLLQIEVRHNKLVFRAAVVIVATLRTLYNN